MTVSEEFLTKANVMMQAEISISKEKTEKSNTSAYAKRQEFATSQRVETQFLTIEQTNVQRELARLRQQVNDANEKTIQVCKNWCFSSRPKCEN